MGGQEMHWLIIGGSGGIGRAVTLYGLQQGHRISATASRRGSARRLRYAAGSRTTGLDIWRQRFRGYGSVRRFARKLQRKQLPDAVVIAYGPLYEGDMPGQPTAEWQRMALHNLVLPGACVSTLLPRMLRRGHGTIILFGGTDTDRIQGFRRIGSYAAAKTGVSVLAASAARSIEAYTRAHGPVDVRVYCVCPAYVDTEYLSDEQRQRFARLAGSAGLESPDSYGLLVESLIRGDEKNQNGAILNMKNGRTL